METQAFLDNELNLSGTRTAHKAMNSPFYDIPSEILHFREGDVIFREGEIPRGFYCVQSGCVKIIVNRLHARGRTTSAEYVTKLVSPGEFFGYKALVRNGLLTRHAKALRSSTVWLCSHETMMKAMGSSDPLVQMMMSQAINDIEASETASQLNYLASVQERIAHQLVILADKFGVRSARGNVLNLKLTRGEFAQLACTINESLSRHLTEFKNEGLIDLNGREIVIRDRAGLVRKSGHGLS